jgi:uncharacterized protein YecA (UPF0149 family)
MPLTQNEILASTRAVLKQVPFRTNFERENFVYSIATGPRLLVSLCQEMEFLNSELEKAITDWQKQVVLDEMNIINTRIAELKEEIGPDVAKAVEDAEPQFWVEELARKAAVEALTQNVTTENMAQMLKLPAELYEQTISRCQTFLNVINKTTRIAERKANLANVDTSEE